MNWNKTLFPARSMLIGWPTIRDTGASPGLMQVRGRLAGVSRSPISSAASTLSKAGHAKRQETAKAKRDRVHAELGAK